VRRQLSIEELVGRYRLACAPLSDLIMDYLRVRQPALDYANLHAMFRALAGLFWAEIETLAPGIDTIPSAAADRPTVEGRAGDQNPKPSPDLMGAEADALCGANYGERSTERTNQRNGYRNCQFDTRTGSLDLANPEAAAWFVLSGLAAGTA
jgi:hypothetical protein